MSYVNIVVWRIQYFNNLTCHACWFNLMFLWCVSEQSKTNHWMLFSVEAQTVDLKESCISVLMFKVIDSASVVVSLL